MKPVITIGGFDATFAANRDPWNTFANRDERLKRKAIVHALGPAKLGLVWEPACGNGSNIKEIASRALQLKSSDGSATAVEVAIQNNKPSHRIAISQELLPPGQTIVKYDAIIFSEILYYLKNREFQQLANGLDRWLKPGGRLILAHHHIDFNDFAQRAQFVHRKLQQALKFRTFSTAPSCRTSKWAVELFYREK